MSRRGGGVGVFTAQDTVNATLPPVVDDTETLSSVNFFSGFGDWTTPGVNDPAAGSWTRANSRTGLTGSTGPAGGAAPVTLIATDGQFFGFNEASGPFTGDEWSLESPQLDASLGLISLDFQLFMRFGVGGALNDGTLRVQGWNGSAWSNIGPAIVGSKQVNSTDAYFASATFGTYDSTGFSNNDFRFRFLFTRGTDPDTFNYDCALDNVNIVGPSGALTPPPPPPPSPDPQGIFFTLSGEDGVESYTTTKGFALNYPNPEQPHNRVNQTANPAPFAGSRSLGSEVRKSDGPTFVDTGTASGKRRVETSGRNGSLLFDAGDEYWLGFALYLPSNPMASIRGCSVMQLHAFSQEMLQMSVFAGNLQMVGDGPSTNNVFVSLNLVNNNLLDRWFKLRLNFRPSNSGTGFLRIWVDDDVEGSPTVDYSGRTSPGNAYFKHGCYWWGAANDNTTSFARALHDNFAVGDNTSDFDSVDPALFVRGD